MAQKIQIKRGLKANTTSLTLSAGELALATDTGDLYAGDGTSKKLLNPVRLDNAPTFTVSPLVPTVTAGDSSQKIASTGFVTNAISTITSGVLMSSDPIDGGTF